MTELPKLYNEYEPETFYQRFHIEYTKMQNAIEKKGLKITPLLISKVILSTFKRDISLCIIYVTCFFCIKLGTSLLLNEIIHKVGSEETDDKNLIIYVIVVAIFFLT